MQNKTLRVYKFESIQQNAISFLLQYLYIILYSYTVQNEMMQRHWLLYIVNDLIYT